MHGDGDGGHNDEAGNEACCYAARAAAGSEEGPMGDVGDGEGGYERVGGLYDAGHGPSVCAMFIIGVNGPSAIDNGGGYSS